LNDIVQFRVPVVYLYDTEYIFVKDCVFQSEEQASKNSPDLFKDGYISTLYPNFKISAHWRISTTAPTTRGKISKAR
jgi:hypothetical protein